MTKDQWKDLWRSIRIARKELEKQYLDCMLYGTGYIEMGPNVPNKIRHIPLNEIVT